MNETKKTDDEHYVQFQTRACSGKRVQNQNTQSVVQATDTAADLDQDKLGRLISRLLDLRDTDHRAPPSGRPE